MSLNRTQKIGIAGVSLLVFSVLYLSTILPFVTDFVIKKKCGLKHGTFLRDHVWGKFPFIIENRFYIFNVTNPYEIQKGEKPILQEVGPFFYDEYQEKSNQVDREEDDTVSFSFRSTFFFNAEKSNYLTGEEVLIVPHYFILGMVNAVLKSRPGAMSIIDRAVNSMYKNSDTIFVKAKAKDILFNGIPVDCTGVKDFAELAVCIDVSNEYSSYSMKMVAENKYEVSVFGLRNATDLYKIRVYRGSKDLKILGNIIEFNNKPNSSIWNDNYCDTFNGTDGTVFQPYIDKKGRDVLVFFRGELCRNIFCTFDSKSKVAGFNTLRYTTTFGVDGENNPLQACFCEAPGNCLKRGVFDAYKCTGSPLIFSNPHFYLADPYYLSSVVGLNPIKEEHMMILDLDPFTGVPIHVNVRVQVNMMLRKIEKFRLMNNFPDGTVLPMFWFDQRIDLPEFLLKEVRNGHRLYNIGLTFQYLCIFGGLGLSACAGYLHYKSTRVKTNKLSGKVVEPKENNKSTSGEKKMQMNISTLQPIPVPLNVE